MNWSNKVIHCTPPSSPQLHSAFTIDALLLFPHQLFASNAVLAKEKAVYLIEDALYFRQYTFHRQKLVLHRAAMRAHAAYLRAGGVQVHYIDSQAAPTMDAALRIVAAGEFVAGEVAAGDADAIHYIDPVDDWLERRLQRSASLIDRILVCHDTDMFLNGEETLERHFRARRAAMAGFYAAQRKRLNILVEDGKPVGGKWSFDAENRKRLPAKISLPAGPRSQENDFVTDARVHVDQQFPDNPGETEPFRYPVTYADARLWLAQFLNERLERFGVYEDAMAAEHSYLFHSALTPMLNCGLLTPREVVDATLAHARTHAIPLNSLEGFLRQVIGWREYVRGAYVFMGRAQRTSNFWRHERPLPRSFWNGTTGILPIDAAIRRILTSAYAHHIERLMLFSNFMLLCEIRPDDAYRWFMEMFIDAYDWVMVPNVYGMGLHADGGLITTKPYISGSAYVLKMSDFPRGPWCSIWDGLFWRFIAKHRDYFAANPRLSVMLRTVDRMGAERLAEHIATADAFLAQLA